MLAGRLARSDSAAVGPLSRTWATGPSPKSSAPRARCWPRSRWEIRRCSTTSEHAYYFGSWGLRKCDTPYAIAWDGSALWALDNGLREVVNIDPSTASDHRGDPAARHGLGHRVFRLDSLGGRAIRTTCCTKSISAPGYIDRVDPLSMRVAGRYPIGWYSDDVIEHDGAIFVRTGGLLSRFNTDIDAIEWSTSGPGFLGRPGIDELGVASDGIWLSGSSTERMDPRTGRILESIQIGSAAVAVSDGRLWLLELDGTVTEMRRTSIPNDQLAA
jgi:hypothetical protein